MGRDTVATMIKIRPILVLVLLFSVSYGFQNPDPDGQTVEAHGGVGAYGLTSCETLHIYDYRVATAQYKKRFDDRFQVGAAAAYINRVERYAVNINTGEGVPLDKREVLNLGGVMMSASFLHEYVEVTLGAGFFAGRDENGDRILPWPHAIIRTGKMDTVYFGASFADPRPPFHGVKGWVGGYPMPELHLYGGIGTFHPVHFSPFAGVDWRVMDLFALSLTMEYHAPADETPVDLDTSIFGSLGVTFYF